MKKPLPTARGVCRLIGHHYVLVGTQVFVVLFCLVGFFFFKANGHPNKYPTRTPCAFMFKIHFCNYCFCGARTNANT